MSGMFEIWLIRRITARETARELQAQNPFNLLNPNDHVMHHQFNIQQL